MAFSYGRTFAVFLYPSPFYSAVICNFGNQGRCLQMLLISALCSGSVGVTDCTGEVWMLCKTKGRFWTSPVALFRTCFAGPRDYFSTSPWEDELQTTDIFQRHIQTQQPQWKQNCIWWILPLSECNTESIDCLAACRVIIQIMTHLFSHFQ